MSVVRINEENAFQYSDRIPEEYINDFSREYFRGLVCIDDDETNALIIWQLRNMEVNNEPNSAEILFFQVDDEESAENILRSFEESLIFEDIKTISFEMAELGDEEEEALTDFGFEINRGESSDIHVTVEELSNLSFFHKNKKIPSCVKGISELNPRQFKAGIMNTVLHGKYGLNDDLPLLPMSRYAAEISCCVITDNRVNGYLLVHRDTSQRLLVELMFAIEPDAKINLLNMMRYSINKATDTCDEDTVVILRKHNRATTDLINKLFPDKTGTEVVLGTKSLTG